MQRWQDSDNKNTTLDARNRSSSDKHKQITPAQLIDEAISTIRDLLKFGKTSERLSILASAYKRKAWISHHNETVCNQALDQMEENYAKASQCDINDTYPLFNHLTAKVIITWRKNKTGKSNSKNLRTQIKELAQSATLGEQQTDFWALVEFADFQLLNFLALGDIAGDENKAEIIKLYADAKKRAGSPRQFLSVTDHIGFLQLMIKPWPDKGEQHLKTFQSRQAISAALQEILKKLTTPQ